MRFTYSGVGGYHPLLAVAGVTGDVLMARLRGGNAAIGRSAGHFLAETIGHVRSAGASGQLTVRADSGFYDHAVAAVCRARGVRFSITVRQHRSVRRAIEAIPDDAWTPIPYWLDDGAETTYMPFKDEPDARPVRLIVRRVRPTPGSQLEAFVLYDYHPFITDRAGETLTLEADHRRHAEVENAMRDLKYGVGLNHLPARWPWAIGWTAALARLGRSRCWPDTRRCYAASGPAGACPGRGRGTRSAQLRRASAARMADIALSDTSSIAGVLTSKLKTTGKGQASVDPG